MKSLPLLTNEQIVALRPSIARPTPGQSALDVISEWEAVDKQGQLTRVLTVFLRGSECPFRCLMCDLWKQTHPEPTLSGDLPQQVRAAILGKAIVSNTPLANRDASLVNPGESPIAESVEPHRWIKLYNASNFFAPVNVPESDLPTIAGLLTPFDRVIVENHPRLLNQSIISFRSLLPGRLEIAMGLETIHAPTLVRLNKQMDVAQFRRACEWLHGNEIDIRTFILLRPPGMTENEGIDWCCRSVRFAHELGIRHIGLIPLRAGNGAIEHLRDKGLFAPPSAAALETVLQETLDLPHSIVTVDLWDWSKLQGHCDSCRVARRRILERANLEQMMPTPHSPSCPCTSSGSRGR